MALCWCIPGICDSGTDATEGVDVCGGDVSESLHLGNCETGILVNPLTVAVAI